MDFWKFPLWSSLLVILSLHDCALCHSFWNGGERMSVLLVHHGTHCGTWCNRRVEKKHSKKHSTSLSLCYGGFATKAEQKHCHILGGSVTLHMRWERWLAPLVVQLSTKSHEGGVWYHLLNSSTVCPLSTVFSSAIHILTVDMKYWQRCLYNDILHILLCFGVILSRECLWWQSLLPSAGQELTMALSEQALSAFNVVMLILRAGRPRARHSTVVQL